MFKFGKASKARLETCHPDLQRVMRRALETSPMDFTIVCGHRAKDEQEKAFAEGKSKVRYPRSRHNSYPSEAVDIAPYVGGKLVWDDEATWRQLVDHIQTTAYDLGVYLRWGGDWDGDGLTRTDGDLDERFVDYPHFELLEG